MKKIVLGFLILLFAGSNAFADFIASPFYWDLSKIGYSINDGSGATILNVSQELGIKNTGLVYPLTTIVQDLGDDNILSNKDTFTEFGLLGIVNADDNGFNFYDNNSLSRGYIVYEFVNLSGWIDNVVDIGGGNYVYNIFFNNSGTVNLKYTDDSSFSTYDGTIASYGISDAGATGFTLFQGLGLGGGTFAFDLSLDNVYKDDFWFFSMGDAKDLLAAGYSINAESTVTAVLDKITPADGEYILKVKSDGAIQHAVPEPSTMLLLGAGLLGLGAVARRRR